MFKIKSCLEIVLRKRLRETCCHCSCCRVFFFFFFILRRHCHRIPPSHARLIVLFLWHEHHLSSSLIIIQSCKEAAVIQENERRNLCQDFGYILRMKNVACFLSFYKNKEPFIHLWIHSLFIAISRWWWQGEVTSGQETFSSWSSFISCFKERRSEKNSWNLSLKEFSTANCFFTHNFAARISVFAVKSFMLCVYVFGVLDVIFFRFPLNLKRLVCLSV